MFYFYIEIGTGFLFIIKKSAESNVSISLGLSYFLVLKVQVAWNSQIPSHDNTVLNLW